MKKFRYSYSINNRHYFGNHRCQISIYQYSDQRVYPICFTALRLTHTDDWPLLPVIKQFLYFLLKQNYFIFKNKLFFQKHGTAMGTKMVLSYANVFMASLEDQFLHAIPIEDQPYIWIWYIEDIILIWTHDEDKFLDFLNKLHSFHPSNH